MLPLRVRYPPFTSPRALSALAAITALATGAMIHNGPRR